MSNAEDFFFGSGRSRHDPVTGFFTAMRDAWLTGAGLKENGSGQSVPGGNPGAALPASVVRWPMISALGAMADLAAASRQGFGQPGSGETHPSPGGGREPAAADLLLPIGQAMMIAANRSVSYWLGLAQIFESHQATLVQAIGVKAIDGHVAGPERRVTADTLRALLREVGDLATREARLLQNELSALDENLVQTFQQPEPSGSYRRRWRAKV
jgi:hypothetical protein